MKDIIKLIEEEHQKLLIEYQKFRKNFNEKNPYPLDTIRWTFQMDQIASLRAQLKVANDSIKELAKAIQSCTNILKDDQKILKQICEILKLPIPPAA